LQTSDDYKGLRLTSLGWKAALGSVEGDCGFLSKCIHAPGVSTAQYFISAGNKSE